MTTQIRWVNEHCTEQIFHWAFVKPENPQTEFIAKVRCTFDYGDFGEDSLIGYLEVTSWDDAVAQLKEINRKNLSDSPWELVWLRKYGCGYIIRSKDQFKQTDTQL